MLFEHDVCFNVHLSLFCTEYRTFVAFLMPEVLIFALFLSYSLVCFILVTLCYCLIGLLVVEEHYYISFRYFDLIYSLYLILYIVNFYNSFSLISYNYIIIAYL